MPKPENTDPAAADPTPDTAAPNGAAAVAAAAPDPAGADPVPSDPEAEAALRAAHPAARRMAALDRLAATRTEQPAPEAEVKPDADAPAGGADAQLAEQLASDDRPVDAGQNVTVKIDGEERNVPIAELVRNYQINRTADARLQQATELLRSAREQVRMPASAATVDTVQPSKPDLSSARTTVMGKVKDALGKVFVEGEEAAAGDLTDALLEAIAVATPAPATPPSIDTQAVATVVAQQIEQGSALKEFLGTYVRIAENPYLQAAADDALNRVLDAHPDMAFGEALKTAGNEVYQTFGYQLAAPGAPNTPAAPTRADALAAKKAGLKPVPIRTGSALPPQEPVRNSEQSRTQTIAEMAARRRPPNRALQ